MRVRVIGVAVLALVAIGCSSSGRPHGQARRTTTSLLVRPSTPPSHDRVVFTGDGTLDGLPFDSQFVGAVVLQDGLVTPCQVELPPVSDGRYSVPVYAATESAGCGAPGRRVALWIYANNRIVFSTNTAPWPGNGESATFAPSYSSATPDGAAPVAAQFTGNVRDARGTQAAPGARVEAYVGATLCGVASVRYNADYTGFVLSVVGPDSVTGCTRGAPIVFRVDGRPATGRRVVNTPPGKHDAVDLTST